MCTRTTQFLGGTTLKKNFLSWTLALAPVYEAGPDTDNTETEAITMPSNAIERLSPVTQYPRTSNRSTSKNSNTRPTRHLQSNCLDRSRLSGGSLRREQSTAVKKNTQHFIAGLPSGNP